MKKPNRGQGYQCIECGRQIHSDDYHLCERCSGQQKVYDANWLMEVRNKMYALLMGWVKVK